jgi:hypothetical protein
MFIAFTLTLLLVGFSVLLSPPLRDVRTLIGLPEHLPGARYNPDVGAADIISQDKEGAEFFLARVTFIYHSVFMLLLYATIIIFAELYLENESKNILMDISGFGALLGLSGGVIYSYVSRDFFWHGVFILGLAVLFVSGFIILMKFRPKGILEWNIWASAVLLMIGGVIGGWLGASFMEYRHSFLEALIESRFNPDLAEENIFWRALTSHEHAMIAVALTLIFLLAIAIVGLKEGKWSKRFLFLVLFGQVVMALASYSVWVVGKIAHLIITPSALVLIFSTLILSFKANNKGALTWGLRIGNIMVWLAVAVPGAIAAINLKKPILLNPNFRDPIWDWAELAFNIGHWHILLTTWGLILLLIYMYWPRTIDKHGPIFSWIAIIGYSIAVLAINLYAMGNPPGEYVPNPYDNIWLTYLVEPGLIIMSIGVGGAYILYLLRYLRLDS